MPRNRIAGLLGALAAALALAASCGASIASAEWHVAGSPLGSPAALERTVHLIGETTFVLNTSPAVKIRCLEAGGLDIGESVISPRTEFELRDGLFNWLQYGSCEALEPSGCTLLGGKLKTTALTWTVTAGTSVEVTLAPLSGSEVFKAELAGLGCPLSKVIASGSLIAELTSGKTEAAAHTLLFKGVGGGGTLSSAEGKAQIELSNHANWSWH